jgi:6-pyruvoyltetrahydropterin/6-carboxytetrahydropterin synthase
VRVRVPIPGAEPAEETVAAFSVLDLERIVRTEVLDRFDHAHLNLDTEIFSDLIPSVEHIARICHELLEPEIRSARAELAHVTVWETEKTSCTYPA